MNQLGKFERAASAVYQAMQRLGLLLACGAMVGIVVVMLREVVGRYVFNNPTGWADEVAGYLGGALAFLGVAGSLRSGQMLAVTVLTDRFNKRWRDRAEAFAYLASFALGCLVFWHFSSYVVENFESGRRTQTGLLLRLWIPQSFMAFGFLLLLIELLRQAFMAVKDSNGEVRGESEFPSASAVDREVATPGERPGGLR